MLVFAFIDLLLCPRKAKMLTSRRSWRQEILNVVVVWPRRASAAFTVS